MARGDRCAARQLSDRLLRHFPRHVEGNLFRCDLALNENDPESALQFLARVGDEPALGGARARFREGVIFLQLGRASKSEEALLKSLALDPAARDAEFKLRELYMLQLRRDDLRELLRSRRAVHAWGLADLLDFIVAGHVPRTLVGNWLERIATLAKTDPDDIRSQQALAVYHSVLGKHADAADIARRILQTDARNAEAMALLTEALLNLDQTDEAQNAIDRIPVEVPQHPWILRCQGRLAFAAAQYSRAIEYFEASLGLEPGDPTVHYQLGLCLERTEALDRATVHVQCGRELQNLVDTAQRILKKSQTDRDTTDTCEQLLRLAELLSDSKLWEDAMYCCEFVLRIEPQNYRVAELHSLARRSFQMTQSPNRLARINPASNHSPNRTAPVTGSFDTPSGLSKEPLRFEDVSSKLGVTFEYFTGNTGNKYLFETLGGGASVLDFDNDGWPDLYFSQGSRFPARANDLTHRDQLYRNIAGMEFLPVTEAAGLGDSEYTIGGSAGDFDNDGFTDLFIANYGRNRAYRNNGDGTFSDVSQELGIDVQGMNTSLALADLDRDGDLDLYVVNYLASIDVCRDRSGALFTCHPSMFEAEQDVLIENLGDGRFQDVTEQSGVRVPDGKGLGIVIADLDNDSWPDIYVANDTTPNFLFRNVRHQRPTANATGLRFEECGLLAGAALSRDGLARAGMGIACADFDANGFLDLYVTNYYLETNGLFLNQGRMTFVDSLRPTSLVAETIPWLGFGTQPFDADLDGYIDLFVANGHVDDYRRQDRNAAWKMPPKLYRNGGLLNFADVSASAGEYFQGNYLGRGVTRLDWNRDARPDLVVVHQNEQAALLENVTAAQSHRVVLELVGTASNRDSINTRCWVTTGGERRLLEISSGDGYLASNERRQIIGLGEHASIENLEILWPSGRHESHTSLAADTHITIVEGRPPKVRRLRQVSAAAKEH